MVTAAQTDPVDFLGYRTLELADDLLGLTVPVGVLYPTDVPGEAEHIGPYRLNVSREAPVRAGQFPLVIVSHGSGGSPWVYRTLAWYLAQRGFIVGLPEHPFNNRTDNSWQGTIQNLTARPRHLQMAIDALTGNESFATALKPDAVAVIGHSMGGYTALALAGGLPTSFPHESPDGQAKSIVTVADSRVKALVLLAPATVWFMASESLRQVRVPVLLLSAEKDTHTPYQHTEIILNGLAAVGLIEHRVVVNAGHFSFLSPFPESMQNPAFPPSQDPPGFDRAAFHEQLNDEVCRFLTRQLRA